MQDFQEIYVLIGFGILIMLTLAVTFVVFIYRSQKRMLLQKVNSQEEMIQKTILAQEEERQRIAADLHDEIGSKLNVIHLYTHQFLQKGPSKLLENQVKELSQIINETIQTTRRISHELLPPTLEELGFVPALEELCHSFSATSSLQIQLDLENRDFHFPNKLNELNLFRIVQELINNSIKHGKASEINIRMYRLDQKTKIQYQDNGQGAKSSASEIKKGLGMRNIESRLKIIQGVWFYSLSQNQGFSAEITLKDQQ